MTTDLIESSRPADDAAEWRTTRRDLWVGRSAGRHLGVIEHGRRYAATDAAGGPRGSYRSLEQAMSALAEPAEGCEADAPEARAWDSLALVLTVVVAAAVLLGTYAVVML